MAPDSVPLVFGGETSVAPSFLCSPVAEGSGFQVGDFCWPVPRHRDLVEESPQFIVVSLFPPEEGHGGFDGGDPLLSFLGPVFRFAVASVIDKLEIFSVGDEHLAGLELFDIELLDSKLVIPAVGHSIAAGSLPNSLPGRHSHHFVLGDAFQILLLDWAFDKGFNRSHELKRGSPHDNG